VSNTRGVIGRQFNAEIVRLTCHH